MSNTMNNLQNLIKRIVEAKVTSVLEEGSRGLRRRQRVERSIRKRLEGNKVIPGNPGTNDPNRQVVGANTEEGEKLFTDSERQSANAAASNFFRRSADAEQKRGERIRGRIVAGGKDKAGRTALSRMASGLLRGNPAGKDQAEIKRQSGGEAIRVTPSDELAKSRHSTEKLRQAQGNATNRAQVIRNKQKETAYANWQAKQAAKKANLGEAYRELVRDYILEALRFPKPSTDGKSKIPVLKGKGAEGPWKPHPKSKPYDPKRRTKLATTKWDVPPTKGK